MAIINVLFGNRTPSGFSIDGVVEFDADLTIEEQHERTAEVTQNPVESGSVISDHVTLQPERVTLQGFVSDSPAAVLSANPGRTQDAFDTLEQLHEDRSPVDVVTGRKTYESMIMTRLEMPRTVPSSMAFRIELQHVLIVEAETALLPDAEDEQTQDLASPQQDTGRQSAAESTEATANRGQSVLRSLLESF